jgi:hypothetical protein
MQARSDAWISGVFVFRREEGEEPICAPLGGNDDMNKQARNEGRTFHMCIGIWIRNWIKWKGVVAAETHGILWDNLPLYCLTTYLPTYLPDYLAYDDCNEI